MNIQQLEYALAVHETKHFSRAAELCHVTQATLSAMIKKLEEELDFVLFDRKTKPIRTTEKGLVFVEKAQQIVQLKEELLDLKHADSTDISGSLKIGVIPTVAGSLLPHVVPELLRSQPLLELNFTELTTEEIIIQLKSGKIDLGILATPLEDQSIDESILYYEAMFVYGNEIGRKKYIQSEDFQNKDIWLLEEGHCFREQAMTICEIREQHQLDNRFNLTASSFDTLMSITREFGGITFLPELYYQNLPIEEQKKIAQFKAPIPVREISLVSYRPLLRDRTVRVLSDQIRECIEPRLLSSKYPKKDLQIIGI